MAINKKYIFSTLLVIVLLMSVGTLVWGAILLINARDGGQYVRVGSVLTFISTMWLIVANLDKKPKK
ncbi:MAG TPA: hypothetical protein DCW83_12430 [Saprospirales bacterium]|jgi:hypothetical protein|nr:hypothetical protein [Saprospiraceae bacterium]HAV28282.1 hypothetical protein [Saprospirales bacterium]HAW05488.1 hypothetical protein [Saprospirales bacterium]